MYGHAERNKKLGLNWELYSFVSFFTNFRKRYARRVRWGHWMPRFSELSSAGFDPTSSFLLSIHSCLSLERHTRFRSPCHGVSLIMDGLLFLIRLYAIVNRRTVLTGRYPNWRLYLLLTFPVPCSKILLRIYFTHYSVLETFNRFYITGRWLSSRIPKNWVVLLLGSLPTTS